MLSEQGESLTDQASDPLTLSVLPMGTGSDLCRSLGLPRDPREATKHLTSTPRPIDVGWVSWGGSEGDESAEGAPFINVASFGLSGHVAREVEAKGKGGQLAYLASLFTSARGYQNAPLAFTLTLEDHTTITLERTCYTCALGNARYFGGGMPITPTALLDDGLLELVMVGDLSLPEVTLRLPSLYQGTHVSKPKFERYAVRALEVRPLGDEPVWLELDGEPQRALPARFELRPHALSVTTGPRPPAFSRLTPLNRA
jgi:diacylglycerol kinase family enzyme